MNLRRCLVLSLAIVGIGGEARAHFLFIRIGPMAEAGRSAEVYFSEQAEAGDPRFVAKVAGTKLWLQAVPGKFEPLEVRQATDRLRAPVPASGSVVVVGSCEYGVVARPNETPFLLRYYPKAIAGRPDELSRMTPRAEIPFEIMATAEGDRVRFVVLRKGKPMPGAVLHTVDTDLTGSELTAGGDGSVTWKPPARGMYCVYTRDDTKGPGVAAGKSYEEIREFATIAFPWPLQVPKTDSEAVTLFEDALSARAQWKDFPGFTAELAGETDGRPFTGKAVFQADGTVRVDTDDPVARPWLQDQLGSLAMHRLPEATEDASKPRAKPAIRFGDDEEAHPLGRLLIFDGGRFAASYRVKDQQIMVVNRRTGPKNMTITVLDNERNRDGQFLPRTYVVHYWDAPSGKFDRVETTQERWQRVESWDLPTLHTTTTASSAGLSVRSVTISDHRIATTGK
jgi:hypothetical protein